MSNIFRILGIATFIFLSLACATSMPPKLMETSKSRIWINGGSESDALALATIECKKWGKSNLHMRGWSVSVNQRIDRFYNCEQ